MNESMRIYRGDCLSIPWPDDVVDLVFFSPPYEDARQYGLLNFSLRGSKWVDWLVVRYEEAARVCKGLVACVVNGRTSQFEWSGAPLYLWLKLRADGLAMRKPPLFERCGIPGSGGPDWLKDNYEFIVCGSMHSGALPWSDNTALGQPPKFPPGGAMSHRTPEGTRVSMSPRLEDGSRRTMQYKPPAKANPGNIIRVPVGGGRMGHPLAHANEAPFPEGLAEFFIRSFCPPGGVVLDIMAGSGTTLAAAHRAGRRAIGIDIRPDQCELMQRRMKEQCGLDVPVQKLDQSEWDDIAQKQEA